METPAILIVIRVMVTFNFLASLINGNEDRLGRYAKQATWELLTS